ncbi:MAG: hypothetical protein LBQ12_03010, partial [Deltaproteobacteria bacterium]|nr:hypothetical protein [Deltaproteobacteria bacterium]
VRDGDGGALHGEAGGDGLTGGAGDDRLFGGDGNDSLYGGAGDDLLEGGAGNDYLEGGAGDDVYLFGAGHGNDTVNNAGGGSDALEIGDLDPDGLWFGQSANSLLVRLVDTQETLTVSSWFSGDCKIDVIRTESMWLPETAVGQMLQAMALLGAPGGAGGTWTEDQRQELSSLISVCWQPRQ